MVWPIEQSRSTPVAGDQKRAGGAIVELLGVEQKGEVVAGRAGVAEVEADGLPDLDEVGDGDRAGLLIDVDDAADQEVVAPEAFLVFVDGSADEER